MAKKVPNPFTGGTANLKTPKYPKNPRAPPKNSEEFDGYYRPGPSRPADYHSDSDYRQSQMAALDTASNYSSSDVSPTSKPKRKATRKAKPTVQSFRGSELDYEQARVAYDDRSPPGKWPGTAFPSYHDVSPLSDEDGWNTSPKRKESTVTVFPGANAGSSSPPKPAKAAKRVYASSNSSGQQQALPEEAWQMYATAPKNSKKAPKPPTIAKAAKTVWSVKRAWHFMSKAPSDKTAADIAFSRQSKALEKVRRLKEQQTGKTYTNPYATQLSQPLTVSTEKAKKKAGYGKQVSNEVRDNSVTSMELPFTVSNSVAYDAKKTFVRVPSSKDLPTVPIGAVPGSSTQPIPRKNIPRKRQNLPPSPITPPAPLKGKEQLHRMLDTWDDKSLPPSPIAPPAPLKHSKSKKGKQKAFEVGQAQYAAQTKKGGEYSLFPPLKPQHYVEGHSRFVTMDDVEALNNIAKAKANQSGKQAYLLPEPKKPKDESGFWGWGTADKKSYKVPPTSFDKPTSNSKGKAPDLKHLISAPTGPAIIDAAAYAAAELKQVDSLRRTKTKAGGNLGKKVKEPANKHNENFPHPWQTLYKDASHKASDFFHREHHNRTRASSDASFGCVGVDEHENYGYTPRGPYDERMSQSDRDLTRQKRKPSPIDTSVGGVASGGYGRRRSVSETRDTRFYGAYQSVLN